MLRLLRKISKSLVLIFLGLTLSHASANAESITIAAAASLKGALESMTPALEKLSPKLKVQWTFGSSGALKAQIAEGAPIDIFLSASPKPMQALIDQKLVDPKTRSIILQNEIIWIAHHQKAAFVRDLDDLKKPGIKRIALGEPRTVPAGEYALEVLKTKGLDKTLESKFIYAKDVRQVLKWVEKGDSDFGFIYKSDFHQADKTKLVLIGEASPSTHSPIIYEVARVITKQVNQEKDQGIGQILGYLKSPEAARQWLAHGFMIPNVDDER